MDLPAPVGPTIANVLRDGTINDTALRTGGVKICERDVLQFHFADGGLLRAGRNVRLPCSTAASKSRRRVRWRRAPTARAD